MRTMSASTAPTESYHAVPSPIWLLESDASDMAAVLQRLCCVIYLQQPGWVDGRCFTELGTGLVWEKCLIMCYLGIVYLSLWDSL